MPALQRLGIAEPRNGRAAWQFRPQQSQIGVGIVAENQGLGLAALAEGQAQAFGARDHMAVGENEAVIGDDHAGAEAGAAMGAKTFGAKTFDAKTFDAKTFDARNRGADRLGDAGDGLRKCVENVFHGDA